jgi:hypothetical protein
MIGEMNSGRAPVPGWAPERVRPTRRRMLTLLANTAAVCGAAMLMAAGTAGAGATPAREVAAHPGLPIPGVPANSPLPASAQAKPMLSLGGVSCVDASFCLGAGPGNQDSVGPTFSQIWNGRTWRTMGVPSGRRLDQNLLLLAVACHSASECVAVGGTDYGAGPQLSDAWNGRSWKMLPAPHGMRDSTLAAVACPSARECLAVGTSGLAPYVVLAQIWNGTSWTLTRPVIPPGATLDNFNGVACSGPSDCLAVGQYSTQPHGPTFTALAESWNGHTWTLLPSPSGLNELTSVACPAAKVCVGVGYGAASSPDKSSVSSALWNGSSWTPLTTPVPVKDYLGLSGISCPSTTDCVAIGPLFAERWTGGADWHPESVPDPGSAYYLSSVSCTSPARCLAVGGSTWGTLQSYASFAVMWNGHAWAVSRTGKVDQLLAVSCVPRGACLVTGTYLDPGDVVRTLAESWNGSRMRLVSPHGLKGALTAVSCPGRSFCAAATEYGAASWNGKHWNWSGINHTPSNSSITYLSCLSRDFCMALSDRFQGQFSEIWNGKTWTSASLKVPGSGDSGTWGSVSCVSPDFCLAVGSWFNQSTGTGGYMTEVWNSRTWRIIPERGLSPAEAIGIAACRTSTDCIAIGGRELTPTTSAVIGATWNARRWKVTKIPGSYPPGESQSDLYQSYPLSCPTATSCVWVNSFAPLTPPPLVFTDIGLIWNGRTWRRTKPGGPQGIASVSCASPRDCVATGLPGVTTLAKLWNGSTWKVIKTINP